jgi:hypothetical protein
MPTALILSPFVLEFRADRNEVGCGLLRIEVEWVTFRHTHASVVNWTRVESLCSCDRDIAIPEVKVECRMPSWKHVYNVSLCRSLISISILEGAVTYVYNTPHEG